MQRVLVAACTIAAALLVTTASARAEDVTGKLGLGADATLSGSQGAQLRYGLVPKLDLQIVLRFDYVSADDDVSASRLDLGVLGHYALMEWSALAFDVFGGITIQRVAFDNGVNDDSATDIGFEVGFGPNWWVTPNLALNIGVGLSILLDNDDPADGGLGLGDDGDFDGNRISFFGDAQLVGGAGFTYWFR